MSASHAYLYDSALQPVGPLGVVVRVESYGGFGSYQPPYDVAIFTPWPAALGEGAEFAVRTVSAGDATRWRKPHEVVDVRAVEQPNDQAGFVVLESAARAPIPAMEAGGGRPSDRAGILKALEEHSETFKELRDENEARNRLASLPPADDGSAQAQLDTPGYVRVVGRPATVNRSLCRILHWD